MSLKIVHSRFCLGEAPKGELVSTRWLLVRSPQIVIMRSRESVAGLLMIAELRAAECESSNRELDLAIAN